MNFGDLTQKVHRRLLSGVREMFVQLTESTDAGDITMTVSGPGIKAIVPGMRIGCELEIFYVLAATPAGALSVLPAQEGSLAGSHDSGTLVTVNPRFPLFECGVAINDDLADLSSPTNGLGKKASIDFSWNPAYVSYDLGPDFDADSSRILEVSYQTPPPYNSDPLIRRGQYKVVRNSTDPRHPSGNGIILYKAGFPGLPIHVQFLAPFSPMENMTDDVTAVAGLTQFQTDLVALGAEILLVQPREIKRNFTESQSDSRKAIEVGPGAIAASSNPLTRQRMQRIDAEHDRIMLAFPEGEGW